MQHRFKAGLGLQKVLIAGTGELGRHVADRLLRHAEFGYKITGFIDDKNEDNQLGYRGLPLLGSLTDAEQILKQEHIDQLYVALPLDQHVNMLKLIEISNRECVDVKVTRLSSICNATRTTRRTRRHTTYQCQRRSAKRFQQRDQKSNRHWVLIGGSGPSFWTYGDNCRRY